MTPVDSEESRRRVEAFSRQHRIALLTMFFSDIVGSTQLKQLLGDRAAIDLIQRHHSAIRELLTRFNEAEEIGTAGDSFFLVFAKPSDAAHFALLSQNAMRRLWKETGRPVLDRIGIHVGEIFVQERGDTRRDLFGIQIDTTARIMSLGGADQILLSRFAFDSARQILCGADIPEIGELTWLNHGYYEMKGVEEPVEVCETGETGLAALVPPGESEKARRFHSLTDEPVLGWRPAPGQIVPGTRWILDHTLGEGGFGEVWLARHEQLKQERVIKFCFNAERARSLKREVTLFRILRERIGDHPNIVAIHDVFFDEAPYYIVMDYVEGTTFDRWTPPGVEATNLLPPKIKLIAQVADALQAAHDSGIIHRDVKPSNVLVVDTSEGALAKLTDFGVGQVVSEEALAGITRLGFTQTMLSSPSASGTQIYMAPEIVAGQPATIRSDIYSLGVMLWQTVRGDFSIPLTADWTETIDDPLLSEDIRRCVAGDPQKRYAGAAQLAARLRALPERRVAQEEEKRRFEALERRAYRRGVLRTTLVAAAILMVFAGLALFAVKQKQEASRILGMSDLAQAQRLFDQDDAAGALAFLARAVDFSTDEVSIIAGERLWFALTQRSWPMPVCDPMRHADTISTAEFDRTGARVLTASADGRAQLWNAKTGVAVGKTIQHAKAIQQASFSPDGRYVATACFDGTGRLWGGDDGEPVLNFNARHEDSINSIAFGSRGDWIATGSRDGIVRIWKVPEGGQLGEFRFAENVHTLRANPANGDQLLAISGRVARLWSVSGSRQLFEWSHQGQITSSDFTADGKLIVTAGAGPFAQIRNSASGEAVARIPVEESAARVVRFSPDGSLLATASHSEVLLWTTRGEPLLQKRPLAHSAPVESLRFRSDSAALYTGTADGKVQLWSVSAGLRLGEPIRADGQITAIELAPNSGEVLVATVLGEARIWRPPALLPGGRRFFHPAAVEAIAVSPKGRALATASKDGSARLWDIANATVIGAPLNHQAGVLCTTFSPDGQLVGTGGADSTARLWQGDTGTRVAEAATDGAVVHFSFSADAKRAATGTETGSVQLWETPSLRPVAGPVKYPDAITGIAFSRDSRRLVAAARDGTVRLLSAETGAPQVEPIRAAQTITSLTANPRRDTIALGTGDGSVSLLRFSDGQPIREPLTGSSPVLSIAFSPDGKRLATGGQDGATMIFDQLDGSSVSASSRHSLAVSAVLFNPSSSRLASASEDGTARIWDAETGQALSEPMKHAGPVRSLGFSNDGRLLFTGSIDGTARCWQMPPSLNQGERARLAAFARAFGPARLRESGRLEPQTIPSREKLRAQMHDPARGEIGVLVDWFLSAPLARSLTPDAQQSVQAFIDALLENGSAPSLDEAQLIAGEDPVIRKRIAEKRAVMPPNAPP